MDIDPPAKRVKTDKDTPATSEVQYTMVTLGLWGFEYQHNVSFDHMVFSLYVKATHKDGKVELELGQREDHHYDDATYKKAIHFEKKLVEEVMGRHFTYVVMRPEAKNGRVVSYRLSSKFMMKTR